MTRPSPPEAIRTSLLDAAIESYTDGGPFSVRDVARRAGVNQGQIHHMFGGKPGLKRAMLERLGRQMLARIKDEDPQTPAAVLAAASRAQAADEGTFARALARSLLESPSGHVDQEEFAVVDHLLAALGSLPPQAHHQAHVLLAEGLAKALGWALFAPWICKAAQLDASVIEDVETRMGNAQGAES
ncbi:MAG: TetR/AcrR family transcriptional regulator [Myxococcota bacterium]